MSAITSIALPGDHAERVISGAKTIIIQQARKSIDGHDLALQDEFGTCGIVKLGKPERIDLFKFAELAGQHGISEQERTERWPRSKKLWAYPVSEIVSKARTVELSEIDADKLIEAQRLAAAWRASLKPFIDRQLRFLSGIEGTDKIVAFLRGLPGAAKSLVSELNRVKPDEDTGKAEPEQRSAIVIGRELLKVLKEVVGKIPDDGIKGAIEQGIKTLEELERISRSEFLSQGGHIRTTASEKRCTAPVHSSGEKTGREVRLQEVLTHVKPIMLRRNAVMLVGGLVNWKRTCNDVDVLLRGPLDDDTRHVVQFRLGRMFPGDIGNRLQFLDDDELGGPFTDHVELADLWLIPRTHKVVESGCPDEAFEIIEMAAEVAKQGNPLMDLPSKRGKRRAAFQFHFRGRSLHGDLRNQVDDVATGWTLNNQVAVKVPIVSELREARRFARRFDKEGAAFLKPWAAPNGLLAEPKGRMPLVWLDIEGEKFEPGEIGSTVNEPGIIVRVTSPDLRVEYGLQKPWAHEYFYTGDPKFTGRLFFRMLAGRGGEPGEEEAGRLTPRGRVFWRSFWTRDLLPSVLTPRAVKTKSMPPDGYSAIPVSLEKVTPPEFQYWKVKGGEARRMRDALVEEKHFTPDNIKIVDGEFRRVVQKFYLDVGEAYNKAERSEYAIAWQWWKGQRVVREGPSRQVWHLVFPDRSGVHGGGFHAWSLQGDPLTGDKLTGTHRMIAEGDLISYEGEVKPGQKIGGEVLNNTKATPSWIRRTDRGRVEVLEESKDAFKLRFTGGKLRGEYVLQQEEKGSPIWLLEALKPSGQRKEADGRGHGATLFADRDDGLTYLMCPQCDSVSLRKSGDERRQGCDRYAVIECNECGCQFGVMPAADLRDRNELAGDDNGADGELFNRAVLDSAGDYLVIKAVPVRDGIQVWDPERKDPDVDRSDLRPLALYQPMKVASKPDNELRDRDQIFERFATPALLEIGIMVEPKYNGFRLSLQKRGSRTLIYTEDEKRDLSKVLPGLAAELQRMPGDFAIDGEGMAVDDDGEFIPRRDLAQFRGKRPVDDKGLRVMLFDALYTPQAGNVTAKQQTDRRKRLGALIRTMKGDPDRLVVAPFKIARSRAELDRALTWAASQPGSEGAMLKSVEATYSLGGRTSSWAKYKESRRIKAIIHKRDPVEGSPGVWTFFGAVGPVSADDAGEWSNTVEINGKRYVPIGKTFNSKLKADVGDVIEVEVTEVLLDKSVDKQRVRWFTPTVIGKADQPTTLDQLQRMLHEGEIKKRFEDQHVAIVKTKEERFVLGIVLEPNDGKDGAPLDPDSQSDIYSAKEIRQTAHGWMEHFQDLGLQHKFLVNGMVKLLESYIAPTDLEIEQTDGSTVKIRKGTWLIAVRVLDGQLWQDVKSGGITGFSIGGDAIRTRVSER